MPRIARSEVPPVYAIADAAIVGADSLARTACDMARAGMRWVQIRAKTVGDGVTSEQISSCVGELQSLGTSLWVNDRPDLAILHGARGIHVGQEDLPPVIVRRLVGEECWIGRSTHNLVQLSEADADPDVDLIALGPIFPTRNKENPDPDLGLGVLKEARKRTDKPLVAIGGLAANDVGKVLDAGADSAVLLGGLCQGDVLANCRCVLASLRSR